MSLMPFNSIDTLLEQATGEAMAVAVALGFPIPAAGDLSASWSQEMLLEAHLQVARQLADTVFPIPALQGQESMRH